MGSKTRVILLPRVDASWTYSASSAKIPPMTRGPIFKRTCERLLLYRLYPISRRGYCSLTYGWRGCCNEKVRITWIEEGGACRSYIDVSGSRTESDVAISSCAIVLHEKEASRNQSWRFCPPERTPQRSDEGGFAYLKAQATLTPTISRSA